jgi:hypothetical protein
MSDDRELFIPVSHDPWHLGAAVDRLMREAIRREFFPWEFPHRNPFPKLDWWPWIDRWRAAPGEARDRLTFAWSVLREGVPPDRDDW